MRLRQQQSRPIRSKSLSLNRSPMTATSNRLGQPNLGAPRMFYWVAGIELRSGTRQEFRIPQLSKVLTIRHGGTYSFRYKFGH